MKLNLSFTPEVSEIFLRFEFPSLLPVLKQIAARCNTSEPIGVRCQEADLGFELVEDMDSDVVALAFSTNGTLYLASEGKVSFGLPEKFRRLLEDKSVAKAGFDLKSHIRCLSECGIEIGGRLLDVELMHYLINPERSHTLETVAKSYLGVDLLMETHEQAASLFDPVEDKPDELLQREVYVTFRLAGLLSAEISSHGLEKLYDEIEAPLIPVLAKMEMTGVKVDVASLGAFAEDLRNKMLDNERQVRSLSGLPDLNVSSPKQVGVALFEKMRLDPKAKKPRSGNWPTDEQTLRELSDRSPIIGAILDYRSMHKLLSSYIEPFPGFISAVDGRVHTCFNQALTATGRLSSSNPNLQNIPVRTEMGREIRKAFVPGQDGWVMMSADYSQIELRIMAHLCGDEHLIDAFRRGEDVHSATASKIFHVDVSEVTPDQRRVAKTANFGIMYGISAFGLSQRLGCSRTEARQIIDDYFESFPSIRRFIDETVAFARTNGYVETIFGRRRYLPDINSQNATLRAVAERNAVNAPIQGTAADIIKIAMVRMDKWLCGGGLLSRMVLQIHDELLLEVPSNEIEKVRVAIKSEMENVIKLSVPLTVECNYGKTWLEAH